jgi:hypothetical protein
MAGEYRKGLGEKLVIALPARTAALSIASS